MGQQQNMTEQMEEKEKIIHELKLELRKNEEKVNMLGDNVDRLSLENTTLKQQVRQLEVTGDQGKSEHVRHSVLYITSTI